METIESFGMVGVWIDEQRGRVWIYEKISPLRVNKGFSDVDRNSPSRSSNFRGALSYLRERQDHYEGKANFHIKLGILETVAAAVIYLGPLDNLFLLLPVVCVADCLGVLL